MTLAIPDLPTCIANARSAFTINLPGADSVLRRSVVSVLSRVIGGFVWMLFRYQLIQSQQLFLATMTGANLDLRGQDYAMPRQGSATAAGSLLLFGLGGTPIAAGTQFLAPDNVTLFATQALNAITPTATSIVVAVVAQTAGAAGNLPAGTSLRMVTAIAGLAASGTLVDDGTGHGSTGGIDVETDASYRARLQFRLQNPPQGGSTADYYRWARAVSGVTRAWIFPLPLSSAVQIFFVLDARSTIAPLSADLVAMTASIASLRPVTAQISAYAPTLDVVAITVANLVASADIAATQAAIVAAVAALFTLRASCGGAALGDGIDASHSAGSLSLADIYAAIRAADGVVNFDLVTPSADLTSAVGHLAVPNVIFA